MPAGGGRQPREENAVNSNRNSKTNQNQRKYNIWVQNLIKTKGNTTFGNKNQSKPKEIQHFACQT